MLYFSFFLCIGKCCYLFSEYLCWNWTRCDEKLKFRFVFLYWRIKRHKYQGRMSIEFGCQHILSHRHTHQQQLCTDRSSSGCEHCLYRHGISQRLYTIRCTIFRCWITCSTDATDTSMIIISTVKYLWNKTQNFLDTKHFFRFVRRMVKHQR